MSVGCFGIGGRAGGGGGAMQSLGRAVEGVERQAMVGMWGETKSHTAQTASSLVWPQPQPMGTFPDPSCPCRKKAELWLFELPPLAPPLGSFSPPPPPAPYPRSITKRGCSSVVKHMLGVQQVPGASPCIAG